MAHLSPFVGWRYAPTAGPLAELAVPLGDVFDPSRHGRYRVNPYSNLHVLRAPSPDAGAATLAHWKRRGIIRPDAQPAYYPLTQTFCLPGDNPAQADPLSRRGFLALVRLDAPHQPPTLLPHEATLPGPVHAGLTLLQSLAMQMAPIHGLYHDPTFALEALLEPTLAQPLAHFVDGQGVDTRLGMVNHPDALHTLAATLAPLPIYLADGHHRLAAAQAHLQHLLQRQPHLPPDHPARFALFYLSNAAGPDLHILPTHRVLRLPPDQSAAALPDRLRAYFDVVPLAPDTVGRSLQPGTLHLVTPTGAYRLRLRPGQQPDALLRQPLPAVLRKLDYTLLHDLIIDQIIGLPYAEQWASPDIRYLKDAEPARQAGSQPGHVAFLLGELALADLMAACHAGAVLPPKSTYFYPKALSGLVMAAL